VAALAGTVSHAVLQRLRLNAVRQELLETGKHRIGMEGLRTKTAPRPSPRGPEARIELIDVVRRMKSCRVRCNVRTDELSS
jgi:hypothetical protein